LIKEENMGQMRLMGPMCRLRRRESGQLSKTTENKIQRKPILQDSKKLQFPQKPLHKLQDCSFPFGAEGSTSVP
jgi:hypothetical protein